MRTYYIAYQIVVYQYHNMQDRTVLQEPEGISYWNHSLWQQTINENTHKCLCNHTGYRLKKSVAYIQEAVYKLVIIWYLNYIY